MSAVQDQMAIEGYSICRSAVGDADELASQSSGWNVLFEQLTPGRFEGSVEEVWIGPIQILHERGNQAMLESGENWKGSRTVGVVDSAYEAGIYFGTQIHASHILTLKSGEELALRVPRMSQIISATVDCEMLDAYAASVEHYSTEGQLEGRHVVNNDIALSEDFRTALLAVIAAVRTSPALLDSPAARKSLTETVLNAIVRATSKQEADAERLASTNVKRWVVREARNYIMSHIEEPITVPDLCRHLNVSRRTLQYCFQDVLDLNPVAYLRMLRLNGARRDLKRADPATHNVTDIAADWGFWHLARFATHYREMFGERPSETLNRKM